MSETIRRLDTTSADFNSQLQSLLAWDESEDITINQQVADIIAEVRKRGDTALIEYTQRFDRFKPESAVDLEVSQEQLKEAFIGLPSEVSSALQAAAQRIRDYAEKQKLESWQIQQSDGTLLGQKVTALQRVGLYVPGGLAAYPSSVLMNAIPAKVAGVSELIMVVPTPDAQQNELVLAAAHLAGVDRLFNIGGAQAIAALAYGTETIPRVNKIVGPGNIYVATAKKMVFGQVGIDMIAGPSEILVVCDGGTPADWIAKDLFSQAEHDENAQAILLSPDADFLNQVQCSIDQLLPSMQRADVIRQSLKNRGALIKVLDLKEAAAVVNQVAPEHLELSIENPDELLAQIENAGAIFMGRYTAEALGDYCAGPNHVLPTSGTARFSSPLGVYDFQKRSSLINCSKQGAQSLGQVASVLARGEGLIAHALSAEARLETDGK